MTIADDLASRSPDINWPDGFDPDHSDLFAHNDIVIEAAAQDIWAHLISAERWPSWYCNSSDVVVHDSAHLLGVGVSFDWVTFGLKIHSRVAEFVPAARIGWYGNGAALRAYHTWLLVPRGDSTYVAMEEVGLGPGAQQLATTNPGHMHRGHDLWNISLKFLCET